MLVCHDSLNVDLLHCGNANETVKIKNRLPFDKLRLTKYCNEAQISFKLVYFNFKKANKTTNLKTNDRGEALYHHLCSAVVVTKLQT